ncbi:hypothetical protein [Streptomyces hiroshimensis]|uniref:hypothetical protein n=1 Tax=Streptomyces hiroshimensis TaxID=66424 RepID=UPI0027E40BE3|nr:hypothetical protein [Streptomyces hiroshimensis]
MNPYQQTAPYGQAQWSAGSGEAPRPPEGGRKKTAVIAVTAAAAVVVAAGVTGFLVLGGGKDAKAKDPQPATGSSAPAKGADPTAAESDDNPRAGHDPKPVVPGWKTLVNPKRGIAFDVPPEWDRKESDWVTFVTEDSDDKPLVAITGPAVLNEQWCRADADGDGKEDDVSLASVGSRNEGSTPDAGEAARTNAGLWVYGRYAQPDKKKVETGPAEPYTTKSGLTGSVATSGSSGVRKKNKCDSDGKATAFVFKNAKNELVSWTFYGAKGVKDEVPDETVRKILSTVRLTEPPK